MTDILVQEVSKHFGSVRALEELTFEVPAGKSTEFLGPNGAGKIVTLRMLLSLAAPNRQGMGRVGV